VGNWIKGGPPVTAQGQGGREVRDAADHGEIFDHHMVEFTYADGSTMLSSRSRFSTSDCSRVSDGVTSPFWKKQSIVFSPAA
jgi:hypothetical protein